MNDRDCLGQLDWLALCYAAGELSAAETELFELRLAEDQAAREALARAVELTQVVAAAEAQGEHLVRLATTNRGEWHSRLSWMAVGGLAALLLGLLWTGVVGPTWQTAQHNTKVAAQQQLAFAWNETRSELAEVRAQGLWPVVASSPEADDEMTVETLFDDTEIEEAPSWMMAAVFSSSAQDLGNADAVPGIKNERLEN